MMSATVVLYCVVLLIGVLHVQDASGAGCIFFHPMKMTSFDAKVVPNTYTAIYGAYRIKFQKNAPDQYQVTRSGQSSDLTHNANRDAVFTDFTSGRQIAVLSVDQQSGIYVCENYRDGGCCLVIYGYF